MNQQTRPITIPAGALFRLTLQPVQRTHCTGPQTFFCLTRISCSCASRLECFSIKHSHLFILLISEAGSLIFFVIDSVCPSVTPLQIDSSFFVSRWNRAIFCPSSLHVALYKTLFFDFWFMPPNAQNLLLKICNCKKSPLSRLVWQIHWDIWTY